MFDFISFKYLHVFSFTYVCLCADVLCKQLCTHIESIIRPPLLLSVLVLWGRISLWAWNLCFGGLGWKPANPFSPPAQRWITAVYRTRPRLFYGCWIQTPALMPEQQALLMDELVLQPLCTSFDLRYFIFDFCSISWFILATFLLVFWNNIYLLLLLLRLCSFISEGLLFFAVLLFFYYRYCVWYYGTTAVQNKVHIPDKHDISSSLQVFSPSLLLFLPPHSNK